LLILLGFMRPAAQTPPPSGRTVLQAESVRVVVPVTVTDPAGDIVSGLRKDNFKLFVREREVPEFQFLHNSDLPVVIGYVFDHSSRAVMSRFSWNKQVIQALIHQFGFEDVFFIATYGNEYAEVQKPTSDRLEILETLTNLHPYMFTSRESFWSFFKKDVRDYSKNTGPATNKNAIAMDHALYALSGYELPKKALVLASDGDENLSDNTLHHVQRYGVPVYSLFFTGSGFGGQSLFRRGAILRKVSQETGGTVFDQLDGADAAAIGRRIAQVIRSQYLISFEPDPRLKKTDTHAIRLVSAEPGLNLVYRKSFRFVKE
jgi:VWFA-related protein